MSSSIKMNKVVQKKEPTRLRTSPAGPSQRKWNFNEVIQHEDAVCQICGTSHKGVATITSFMHRKMVVECCGKLLDDAYKELGRLFCLSFLQDFDDDSKRKHEEDELSFETD